MDIFETYEKEYKSLYDGILSKATSLSTLSGEQRKLVSNQIKRELEEIDEIIGQMDMELASVPVMTRSKFQGKIKEYKESIKNIKKEVQKSQTTERDMLLDGSNNQDLESRVQDQRARLIQGTERLDQSSRRLEEAHRLALETEQIGISTLGDLHRQRQQIERTRDGLGNADSWIGKSQGLLKLMQKRMMENKMITYGIIALLIILILTIVIAKFT